MNGGGVIDIRTGRPMVTRRGLLRGILAAGVAPAIVPLQGLADGGLRRGLGARLAGFAEKEKEPDIWLDGFAYNQTSVPYSYAGVSVVTVPVAVTGNEALTWFHGFTDNRVANLLTLDANKVVFDYYRPGYGMVDKRTLPFIANVRYVLFSCNSARKSECFIYSATFSKYYFKDGKIV